MKPPHMPMDDIHTEVMHNDGNWYLYGVEENGDEEIREDWIETDLIVYTEDMR